SGMSLSVVHRRACCRGGMSECGGEGSSARSAVLREPQAGELPSPVGMEEIPVGRAGVTWRGDAGAAAQDHLVDHELAVVLADGAGCRPIAGIWCVGAD